jgi:hypothetical protein
LINLIVLTALAACSPETGHPQPVTAIYEMPLANPLPEAYRSLLPPGTEIPAPLPKTIADPYLLTAWVYLYNQTDPITIHDGLHITGRDLAKLVFEQEIEVLWGSEDNCGGNSCAPRSVCYDLDCVANNNYVKIYPVYISQRYQDTGKFPLSQLAGGLAHELYHRSQPFGPVAPSQYEEYWAYYIGAQVAQIDWLTFKGYDSLDAACLKAWFLDNGTSSYAGIDPYPITLNNPAALNSEACGH